jgi:cytoskeletal protein CcmA (bactofilin family)
MWKRGELDESEEPMARPTVPSTPAVSPTGSATKRTGSATIGPSIKIKGDVTGDEDLVIQGRIDGTVNLKKHNVTVGPEGRVKANIFGRSVIIEGEVEGDLQGDEQIVLRRTAKVQGNIAAPRVTLEDGASFRGGIDMQDQKNTHEVAAKAAAVGVAHPGKGLGADKSADKAQGEATKV